jgi:hypothetical protein
MRAFCIRTTDHHCALVQVRRAGETADLLVRTWKDDCV